MRGESWPLWIRALAGVAVLAGLTLRVAWPTRLPDGPWIDEVSAIRAARGLVAAPTTVNPFGTTPILPPEAGFAGAWESNLYFLWTALVDSVAGGGMASVRAVSIGSSVLLLLAGLLLGVELFGVRSRPFAFTAVLLASSAWLLRLGRWGWFNVWTAALMTAALALALRSVRTSARGPAIGAGLLLGLAQYGYLSSTAGVVTVLAAVVLTSPLVRRGESRAAFRTSLVVLGTALLVALPLFVHRGRTADRSSERLRELAPAGGVTALPAATLRNGADLAGLFFGSGDPNPRHGEPGRPLLPLPVGLSVAVGLFMACRAGGGLQATALAGLVALAPNLATKGGPEAVNSFRVLAAAVPLLVLAALAWDRVASALERRSPALGTAVVPCLLLGIGAMEASAFLRWGSSSGTDSLFGGPERRLADELRRLGAGRTSDVLFSGRAFEARTTYVDVLLAAPSSPERGVRVELPGLAGPSPRLSAAPRRADLLFVDLEGGPRGLVDDRLPAGVVARIPPASDRPALRVLRIPGDGARALAEETLRRFLPRPPAGEGEIVADEEGLWRLDSIVGESPRTALVRLLPGRHRSADLLPEGGRLRRLFGADGFPRRIDGVP